jgi:hypothetical protein
MLVELAAILEVLRPKDTIDPDVEELDVWHAPGVPGSPRRIREAELGSERVSNETPFVELSRDRRLKT